MWPEKGDGIGHISIALTIARFSNQIHDCEIAYGIGLYLSFILGLPKQSLTESEACYTHSLHVKMQECVTGLRRYDFFYCIFQEKINTLLV